MRVDQPRDKDTAGPIDPTGVSGMRVTGEDFAKQSDGRDVPPRWPVVNQDRRGVVGCAIQVDGGVGYAVGGDQCVVGAGHAESSHPRVRGDGAGGMLPLRPASGTVDGVTGRRPVPLG